MTILRYIVLGLVLTCMGFVKMPNGAKDAWLLMQPTLSQVSILSTTQDIMNHETYAANPKAKSMKVQVMLGGISWRPAYIQSSPDLTNWTTILRTNADADFVLTIPKTQPKQWFRLGT